jgi:probable rRNA maturation factor
MSRDLELVFQHSERFRESRAPHLRRWLSGLVQEVSPQADSFAVNFVSEEEMRQLNRSYRDRDAPTDVLSFPGETSQEGCHLGDVAISVAIARRQAEDSGGSPYREVQRLLLHGVLHCLGYDHETDNGDMSRMELRLRRNWIRDDE